MTYILLIHPRGNNIFGQVFFFCFAHYACTYLTSSSSSSSPSVAEIKITNCKSGSAAQTLPCQYPKNRDSTFRHHSALTTSRNLLHVPHNLSIPQRPYLTLFNLCQVLQPALFLCKIPLLEETYHVCLCLTQSLPIHSSHLSAHPPKLHVPLLHALHVVHRHSPAFASFGQVEIWVNTNLPAREKNYRIKPCVIARRHPHFLVFLARFAAF